MSVLQMQRISICALKKDRKAILEKIQTMGIMEMNQIADDEDGFEKMDTLEARQSFEKKANLLDTALTILNTYAPEKQSMLSSLEGKKLVDQEKFANVAAAREGTLEKAGALVGGD